MKAYFCCRMGANSVYIVDIGFMCAFSAIHGDLVPLPVRCDVRRLWPWTHHGALCRSPHLEGEADHRGQEQKRGTLS